HLAATKFSGAGNCLEADGDGFKQSADGRRQIAWKLPHAVLPLHEILSKGSVPIVAEMTHARTEMAKTASTFSAFTAGHDGMHGHACANRNISDVRPGSYYEASRFMSEHA